MSVTDRISQVASSVQNTAKITASNLISFSVKFVSSIVISFVVALVLQTLVGFGQLSFLLSLVLATSLLMRLMWKWSVGVTLVFDLICVLVALLLRMYILVAP